jgi:hypothetical protein
MPPVLAMILGIFTLLFFGFTGVVWGRVAAGQVLAPSTFAAVPQDHELPLTLQPSPKAPRSYKSYTYITTPIVIMLFFAWHHRFSLPFFKFDPIQIVCKGELDGHKGAIGQVFNAAFQNPHWSVLTAPDGGTEVQFDGAVQYGRARAFLDPTTTEAFLPEARLGCVKSLKLLDPEVALFKQAVDLTHSYGIDADPAHMFQPNYFGSLNPDPEFFRQFEILRAANANYETQISECADTQTLPTKIDFIILRNKQTFFLARMSHP